MLTDVPESHNISQKNFAWFNNVLFFHYFDTLFSYNIKTGVKRGIRKNPGYESFPLARTG